MSSKKLVSAFLTASTVIWGLGIATLPLANAQSTADLQAQIAALLAQIQQLQAQLNAAQGGSSASYSFTSDLTVGSKGADVNTLQQLLINKGYLTAVSAPTGYFGPLTQAALAKFQAANGISPAAGYFGPKTRAFVNSMGVGGTTGGTTGGTVTPPASGLAVSLSSQNPAAGSLISSSGSGAGSAARVPVLAVNLTASNSGAVTVTDLKVHKTGVLSDSSISGAYLVENGQVLYQYTSLNQGVIDFSSMSLSVSAGQTRTLWVAIDPSSGLDAGNTVGFAVSAASDITALDANNNALTPSGAFPLTGNIFTVTKVSNPSLAMLTIASSSIGTQVTAGTQSNIVGAWSFQGSNSLTYLKGLKFTVIGSANNADIRNVKLNVNGTQVGPTLATVGANGVAYFDLTSSPASLNTGANNVQVFADVMGSPSKDFQFEVLNSYDVYVVDSQYNVPIAVTLGSGINDSTVYKVSIQQGQITVTQDSSTPTGNIAVGQSGVTLAKFDIYAAGEAVKVKFLGFKLVFTGATTTLSTMIKNVSLVDDAGGQVGTTINTPPSSVASCDVGPTLAASGAPGYNSAGDTYVDCFGTSGSPINYIVPANTTRVLSLKADIQSGATFSTVAASLLPESSNLQGLTSSQTGSSSGASGSALSLQSSLLSVSKNGSYGDQTVTPNSTNVKIGSYSFTASSASGIQINTVSIKAAPNGSGSGDIQNMKLMIGGVKFGTTQGVVADAGTYTFSGSPFTVPAGGTTYVDVYADILSGATTTQQVASALMGCSGTSVVSYSAVSCSGTTNGQQLTVSSSGSTVAVGLDSSAPSASQLVMGSTGNSLAAFRFTETSNRENVKLTDLVVTQNTTSSAAQGYSNVSLYWSAIGSNPAGSAVGSAATSSAGYKYTFHFGTPPVIPKNGTLVLTLKGDVATYSSGGATDQSTSTFAIAATSTDVTALGQGSNLSSVISGTPTGNTMTVLRTILVPTATTIGATSGRVETAVDNLAYIDVAANNAGSGVPYTLAITFSGSAIGASTTASDFVLLDQNHVDVTDSTSWNATTSGTCSSSPCTITWTFPTSTNPLVISAGDSYRFTLQTDDTGFAAASGQNPVGLSATFQTTSGMTYYDNSSATGSTVSLPSTVVPLLITTVSFSS